MASAPRTPHSSRLVAAFVALLLGAAPLSGAALAKRTDSERQASHDRGGKADRTTSGKSSEKTAKSDEARAEQSRADEHRADMGATRSGNSTGEPSTEAVAAGENQTSARQSARLAAVEGGDIRIDYIAAAQQTYNHATGDGAADEYDARSIGDKVVESLQGEDFRCGDYALFFAALAVADTATGDSGVAEIDFSWTSEPSGQPGAGFRDFIGASINDNDSGNLNLDGNESVTVVSESTGEAQGKPQLFVTVRVSGLDAGDQVIVALVVQIQCDSPSPTGNLFSLVQSARLVLPRPENIINVGAQTLTLKRVEDLGGLPGSSGTIVIVKDARPDAERNFRFSGFGGFRLDDDPASARPRMRTFIDLDPGTYAVGEARTDGWSLVAINCDDPSGDSAISIPSRTATLELAAGETIRCTFVNERVAEHPAVPGGPAPESGEARSLPGTGKDTSNLLGIALALTAAGAGLLRFSRRRA